MSPGARVTLPWPKDFNALGLRARRPGLVGAEQRPLDEGQLAVFGSGDVVEVAAPESQPQAAATGGEILALGGLPIGEPVARDGPFVMNTRAEILQALEDFEAGRMGRIPAKGPPTAPRPTTPAFAVRRQPPPADTQSLAECGLRAGEDGDTMRNLGPAGHVPGPMGDDR